MVRTRKKVNFVDSRATKSGNKEKAPGLESPGAWREPVRVHRSTFELR